MDPLKNLCLKRAPRLGLTTMLEKGDTVECERRPCCCLSKEEAVCSENAVVEQRLGSRALRSLLRQIDQITMNKTVANDSKSPRSESDVDMKRMHSRQESIVRFVLRNCCYSFRVACP